MQPNAGVKIVYALIKIIEECEELENDGLFAYDGIIKGAESADEILTRSQHDSRQRLKPKLRSYLQQSDTNWTLNQICAAIDHYDKLPLSEENKDWISDANPINYSIADLLPDEKPCRTTQRTASDDSVKSAFKTLIKNLPDNNRTNTWLFLKYNPHSDFESIVHFQVKKLKCSSSGYHANLKQRVGQQKLERIKKIINEAKKEQILEVATNALANISPYLAD